MRGGRGAPIQITEQRPPSSVMPEPEPQAEQVRSGSRLAPPSQEFVPGKPFVPAAHAAEFVPNQSFAAPPQQQQVFAVLSLSHAHARTHAHARARARTHSPALVPSSIRWAVAWRQLTGVPEGRIPEASEGSSMGAHRPSY